MEVENRSDWRDLQHSKLKNTVDRSVVSCCVHFHSHWTNNNNNNNNNNNSNNPLWTPTPPHLAPTKPSVSCARSTRPPGFQFVASSADSLGRCLNRFQGACTMVTLVWKWKSQNNRNRKKSEKWEPTGPTFSNIFQLLVIIICLSTPFDRLKFQCFNRFRLTGVYIERWVMWGTCSKLEAPMIPVENTQITVKNCRNQGQVNLGWFVALKKMD